jgi:hypothetical protein
MTPLKIPRLNSLSNSYFNLHALSLFICIQWLKSILFHFITQGSLSTHGHIYQVINCTKKAVFTSTLTQLTNVNVLVTAVLSNFICDACLAGGDLAALANSEITSHVETLNVFSLSNPGTGILVAPPLPRSVPDWFSAYLPGFSTFLVHEIGRMMNPRIKYMIPFIAPPNYFVSDGVHLSPDAGVLYVNFLVSSADLHFPPSLIDETAQPTGTPAGHVTPAATARAVPPSSGTLEDLGRSVEALTEDVRRRRLQDNLIFARIKEDRNFEINKTREDRCTLSGVTLVGVPPQEPKSRKDFFRAFIASLVLEACPDVVPQQSLV